MKSYVFTDEDFARFSFAVGGWLSQLGMSEWKCDVVHEQIGDRVCAQVQYNCVSKQALFRLTVCAEGDYGVETCPEKLAQHEVLHLLLADYAWLASAVKDEMSDVVISHEHEIITRLMRVLPAQVSSSNITFK